MDGRYEVRATHGKGVFSTVLLAKDRSQAADSPLGMVAIKVRTSPFIYDTQHFCAAESYMIAPHMRLVVRC